MKKAIVCSLFGNYDNLIRAPRFDGWDSVMFTDQFFVDKKGWRMYKIKSDNPKKDSRYYKWMTHKTLKGYDLICYMDGNMQLLREPPIIPTWFSHPSRTNTRDEAKRIIESNKDHREIVIEQMNYYKKKGFNDDYGLFQNGFFVRLHNRDTNKFCETIFSVVNKYSYRDQLATPFALFKTGYQMSNIRPATHSRYYVNIWPHTT